MADTDTDTTERSFLLQRAQPAMTGLIDGSLSTLAPLSPSRSPRISRATRSSRDSPQRSEQA
jgi:hypothetical protein